MTIKIVSLGCFEQDEGMLLNVRAIKFIALTFKSIFNTIKYKLVLL